MTSYQTYNDNQPVEPQADTPNAGGAWTDGADYTKAVRVSTYEPVSEASGDILDTLRTANGSRGNPDATSLRDRLTVGGMEIEVATAIRMGYMSRDIDGRLRATGRTAQDVVNETTREDVKTPADAFFADPKFAVEHGPGERDFVAYVEAKVPRGDLVRAYREGLAGDTINPLTLQRLGEALGMDPKQAEGVMHGLADAFGKQETEALKRLGIATPEDVHHFRAWVEADKDREYREAKHRQLISGDLGGIATLAQTYWRNLDKINPEAIMRADFGPGISVRRASNGEIIVRTPKGEVSWGAAVRTGTITLTPKGYGGGHTVGADGAKSAYRANPNWFRATAGKPAAPK